jgi:hypothetical protein
VSLERLFQRVDARQPDKGHDDVDAVRRRDLCLDLVTDTRLARRISEERRVEQRDQWFRDEFQLAIRKLAPDGTQHLGWFRQLQARQSFLAN